MLKKPQPYIGISGVAHVHQHQMVSQLADQLRLADLDRFVMLGIQTTTITQLHDQLHPSYSSKWYPVGDEIIRSAMPDPSHVTRPFVSVWFDDVLEEFEPGMSKILKRTRQFIRGIQLNQAPWLDIELGPLLHRFKGNHPDLAIILQAHDAILSQATPNQLTAHLHKLPIDYVFFDTSYGRGKVMDIKLFKQYIDAVYQEGLPIGVAVAGGLEASTLQEVLMPLVRNYPDLSFDAEGRLRRNLDDTSHLCPQAVQEYLAAAKNLLDIPQLNEAKNVDKSRISSLITIPVET